ncbi:hypothetical protein QBC35DRAFT_538384 [Podospora australis]|uniref:PNPLA domain-containing protein n=1 Tax=Podospora australis TaxID=1536484 RepID=A0AAN6WRM2_9PEZI|nr:hypothetical protein QBC35DRAFT_538384 [Podospora australis]
MESPLRPITKFCAICNSSEKAWSCVQCAGDFCDVCWGKQWPHRPGAVGYDNRPHEKVDAEVIDRLTKVFDYERTPQQQTQLHLYDIGTTWFGVTRGLGDGDGNRGQTSFLRYENRLADIMRESQADKHPERFPHLVSFVGQTGAGKSTVIKMLIDQEQGRTVLRPPGLQAFPTPVNGMSGVSDHIPTTGDVHLYSDPGTYAEKCPIMYADCEGMRGGEKMPVGAACLETLDGAKSGTLKHSSARMNQNYLECAWAKDAKTQSREFAVMQLYPRILYTFSDVVVFVLREARTFESEVLVRLVEWAHSSIDKSLNQPKLPHLVITLNASDSATDGPQWDPQMATQRLLADYAESIHQVARLRDIVAALRLIGKNISSTKDLLEYYYSSITVVRIPSKPRYMQMDEQVGKLRQIIQENCNSSYAYKRSARMLLNSDRLQAFVTSAYHHFSVNLDEPFDFAKEALRHNQMPLDFGGHILSLMLTVYKEFPKFRGKLSANKLLLLLSRPIASCIMLAAARDNLQGDHISLLRNTFASAIQAAFDQFDRRWLTCAFEKDGGTCCLVKSSHSQKGHQWSTGKIFAKGEYVSPFAFQDFGLENWMEDIERHLMKLDMKYKESLADLAGRKETDIVLRLHRAEVKKFFRQVNLPFRALSHATCFYCIRSIPEHVLPCGHVFCTRCIQTLEKPVDANTYHITCCPINPDAAGWDDRPVKVKFKPRHAGPRVLCLDGGGIRGVVELVILQAIEDELGGHVPVQEFFDLVVGTSFGGIIALGLGVKKWSVSRCMQHFKEVTTQAFTPRKWKKLAFLGHKSQYRTQPLESALKSAFGDRDILFGGASSEERSQIQVAVTSTLAAQNQPVILTNYSHAMPERSGTGNIPTPRVPYQLLRSVNAASEPKVWEAARATAAAPLYFKSFVRQGYRFEFTDGAIHNNCPVWVAHHERKLLWPDVSDRSADMLLSIGTGLGKTAQNAHANGKAELLQRQRNTSGFSYVWRTAFDMLDSQTHCERVWSEYASQTSDGKSPRSNIRLNVQLSGDRPSLDNLAEMESLEKEARAKISQNPDIKEVAHRLIASSFYFEKRAPYQRKTPGMYGFFGTIRCRFDAGSQNTKGLGQILRNLVHGPFQPFFLVQEKHGIRLEREFEIHIDTAIINTMCDSGVFDLPAETLICSATQDGVTWISICLQSKDYLHSQRLLPISGFPRQMFAGDESKVVSQVPLTTPLSLSSSTVISSVEKLMQSAKPGDHIKTVTAVPSRSSKDGGSSLSSRAVIELPGSTSIPDTLTSLPDTPAAVSITPKAELP